MAKKKTKIKTEKQKQTELKKSGIEMSVLQTDVKGYIKNFKADIIKKRKNYLSFAQKWQRKKE